jgi:NAD(P)-dependent dehydrogenase (short-subunit alcohol dehydrogenase family)
MEVNVKSAFLLCKHVLPVMERQGGGVITTISSVASIRWLGVSYVAYSSSKAALNQLTQHVALEYARKGIRANTILPGLMDTPRIARNLAGVYADGDVERMNAIRAGQCPMGRMGDGWDIARAALFLASDEAAYITGVQLPVDGGLTCKID